MSNSFNEVTKILIGNISEKTKELKQISASLERMGIFASCPDTQKNQFKELIRELSMSSQGLEQFASISHGA